MSLQPRKTNSQRPEYVERRDFEIPIRAEYFRCPYCRTPIFMGELGEGSLIEVVCRRKKCKGSIRPFRIAKMHSGTSAESGS